MRRMLARTAAVLFIGGSLVANAGALADESDTASTKVDVSSFPTNLDGEIRRVQSLRADGKFQDAAHALGQMMLVAPDDPRVVGEYGKVLVQQNRPQDAVAFLKRSLELQNGDWTIYSALGVAFDEQGDSKNARLAYQRALVLKPGEPAILNNYALSRMAAGDLVSARQIIAQAAAAGGNDPTIARNVALLKDSSRAAMPATGSPAAAEAKNDEPAVAMKKDIPVSVAAIAPVKVPAPAGATAAALRPLRGTLAITTATQAPRVLGKDVVMQHVPVDPLAGPVAKVSHARKLAAKPKLRGVEPTIATKKPATPSLRMSADAS
jgi:Flp pilus assembly protein TadD